MEYNLGIGSRIKHPKFGAGVIINCTSNLYKVTFIDSGYKDIPATDKFEVLDEMVPETDMVSLYDIEKTLRDILRKWSDASEIVQLGDKWTGGKMILYPGNTGLTPKEIPINQFFHKIVMVRDRIRVLEQKVNASNLSDEEKVDIQQYITRVYGSLTTFNVLFKYSGDQFVGDKGN